jgi:hypothetical protein
MARKRISPSIHREHEQAAGPMAASLTNLEIQRGQSSACPAEKCAKTVKNGKCFENLKPTQRGRTPTASTASPPLAAHMLYGGSVQESGIMWGSTSACGWEPVRPADRCVQGHMHDCVVRRAAQRAELRDRVAAHGAHARAAEPRVATRVHHAVPCGVKADDARCVRLLAAGCPGAHCARTRHAAAPRGRRAPLPPLPAPHSTCGHPPGTAPAPACPHALPQACQPAQPGAGLRGRQPARACAHMHAHMHAMHACVARERTCCKAAHPLGRRHQCRVASAAAQASITMEPAAHAAVARKCMCAEAHCAKPLRGSLL